VEQLKIHFGQLVMEPALRRQKFPALDLVLGRNVVAHETLREGTHRLIVQSRRRELVHDPLKKRPPLALALHDPVSAPQHQGEPAEPLARRRDPARQAEPKHHLGPPQLPYGNQHQIQFAARHHDRNLRRHAQPAEPRHIGERYAQPGRGEPGRRRELFRSICDDLKIPVRKFVRRADALLAGLRPRSDQHEGVHRGVAFGPTYHRRPDGVASHQRRTEIKISVPSMPGPA
jgi:hypothetical protein